MTKMSGQMPGLQEPSSFADGNFQRSIMAVTCGRCNHIYDKEEHQPRLLPCLHLNCLDCLCEMVDNERVQCLQCKSIHFVPDNDITIFPLDGTTSRVLSYMKVKDTTEDIVCDFCDEENGAMFRCNDCGEYLCTECRNYHARSKKYKNHTVIELDVLKKSDGNIESFKTPAFCTLPGHEEELMTFYCPEKECERPLCTFCALADVAVHHNIQKLDEVYVEKLEELKTNQQEVKQIQKEIESSMSLVQDQMASIKSMAKSAIAQATIEFEECILLVQKRKEDVVSLIKRQEALKFDILERQEEELQNRKVAVEDGLVYMTETLRYGNPVSFLEAEPFIRRQFSNLKEQREDTCHNINSTIKFNVGQSKDNFESITQNLGFVSSTLAFSPNTMVRVPETVHIRSVFNVFVQLRDIHDEPVEDETEVRINLVDQQGRIAKSLAPCETQDNGFYVTAFKLKYEGLFKVEILILGETFNTPVAEIIVIDELQKESASNDQPMKSRPVSREDNSRNRDSKGKTKSPRTPKLVMKISTPRRRVQFKCPAFHFDESTQHSDVYLSDSKMMLSNKHTSATRRRPLMQNLASIYHGVAGSIYFSSPCRFYFEVAVNYSIKEDLSNGDVICDIMLSNTDMAEFSSTSVHREDTWSLSVGYCDKCHQVCLQCWDRATVLDHILLGLVSKTSSLKKTIGVFLDESSSRIVVVDATESDILVSFENVPFQKQLWPAFCVNLPDKIDVQLLLRTGKLIKSIPNHLIPM